MPPFSSGPQKSYRENKDGEKDLPAFAFSSDPSAGYRQRKTDDLLSDEKKREYSVLESSEGVDIRKVAEEYLEGMYIEKLRQIERSDESSNIDLVASASPSLSGLSEIVGKLSTPESVSLARYIVNRLLGDELYPRVGRDPHAYCDLIDQFRKSYNYSAEQVMAEVLKHGGEEGARMREVCERALNDLQRDPLNVHLMLTDHLDKEIFIKMKIASLAHGLIITAEPRAVQE